MLKAEVAVVIAHFHNPQRRVRGRWYNGSHGNLTEAVQALFKPLQSPFLDGFLKGLQHSKQRLMNLLSIPAGEPLVEGERPWYQ